MNEISLYSQIKCVERDIKKRQYVYPRLIEQKKMSREKASEELLIMDAVKQTLIELYGNQKTRIEQLGLLCGDDKDKKAKGLWEND